MAPSSGGHEAPSTCASRHRLLAVFEPCRERPARTSIHRPPHQERLRQLPRARQALACESESNAKCGGSAVNSGEGIRCSAASIGYAGRIRKSRLSQDGCQAVGGLSSKQKLVSRHRRSVSIRIGLEELSRTKSPRRSRPPKWYPNTGAAQNPRECCTPGFGPAPIARTSDSRITHLRTTRLRRARAPARF